MSETIFITGVLGQDGAYLAKLALEKGHRVVGGTRRSSSLNTWRLDELGITRDVQLVDFELLEDSNIHSAIEAAQPDRFFNLAAQSFVTTSFRQPLFTSDVGAMGVLRVLEALRHSGSQARFYQASTSEMFGRVAETPQRETTPFYPRSPYGVAKVFGHHITRNYREAHGMHASAGILFNHESPLRGVEFVTRKITLGLAHLKRGTGTPLKLGNLDARRDWGHARDYVRGMWQMTEQPIGGEFVLATGRSSSVREFVLAAASVLGFLPECRGSDESETVVDRLTGTLLASIDTALRRPADVDTLVGDSTLAREIMGWTPTVTFDGLVAEMVEADYDRAGNASS
jgi:GDPmannose 4,6-dehydratase